MTTATPATGDLLGDRYRIEAEAGAGGFARVYEAVDTTTDEAVAIKVPNFGASSNDDAVVEEYFLKEARTLEKIRDAGGHPNIMSLRDRIQDGDRPGLVVDYVEGYELDDAIERTGPLSDPQEVREVGIALCDAVAFLHENEIVYRDLKPDNVMLTRRDGCVTPILIDFNTATGFGAADAREAKATTILGPYKPPEIAEAEHTDTRQGPWSDVYSVGKILLFLLRGTVPKKDGVDPRDFGVGCPGYLAEIVEKATRTHYEERYPNATSMRRVLEAKDPSPPRQATLSYLEEGKRYAVHPGDTVGRTDATGPSPAIAIEDDGEYISTVQVQFDTDDEGTWLLKDRSLNGTYVNDGERWQRVLCESGRERLWYRGEDPTDQNGDVPPGQVEIEDGYLVALVHPSYGVTFEVSTH